MMNTEYVALPESATVADALSALKTNEELLENLNTLFLIDAQERLKGTVPLARLFLHEGATPLASLAAETLLSVPVDEKQDRITEMFDKYNLLTLPVLDGERLAGVITADDIISVLRQKE
jgi:Mg/Co/Ni transporter MgtE